MSDSQCCPLNFCLIKTFLRYISVHPFQNSLFSIAVTCTMQFSKKSCEGSIFKFFKFKSEYRLNGTIVNCRLNGTAVNCAYNA